MNQESHNARSLPSARATAKAIIRPDHDLADVGIIVLGALTAHKVVLDRDDLADFLLSVTR